MQVCVRERKRKLRPGEMRWNQWPTGGGGSDGFLRLGVGQGLALVALRRRAAL
jgi:hypothetical protein